MAGPHAYCNSWGAPRRGHRHQGCDIFALRGTPCVACVSGTRKSDLYISMETTGIPTVICISAAML
ncbi:MAG: hypothetical protein QMD66_04580 [Actinomycetota bacterium]|nr:hypothetical protein [Actinomycetota bacterium]